MLKSESFEESGESPDVASPEFTNKSSVDDSGSGKGSILFSIKFFDNFPIFDSQILQMVLYFFSN